MKKAQKEIDSVLGQDEPTFESVKKLEYASKLIMSMNLFDNALSFMHEEKCLNTIKMM